MPSFSRKPAHALLLAVSATLLGAAARADSTHFELTAYSNAVGGQEILGGDYKAALRKIDAQTHVSAIDAASVSLNRCVALTLTAQWPAAQAACDAAVQAAELARNTLSRSSLQERGLQNQTLAIAYSNRAILKWLTTDAKAAEHDLQHAQTLLPDSAVVAQNVTALGAHSTVAQVRSAEQR